MSTLSVSTVTAFDPEAVAAANPLRYAWRHLVRSLEQNHDAFIIIAKRVADRDAPDVRYASEMADAFNDQAKTAHSHLAEYLEWATQTPLGLADAPGLAAVWRAADELDLVTECTRRAWMLALRPTRCWSALGAAAQRGLIQVFACLEDYFYWAVEASRFPAGETSELAAAGAVRIVEVESAVARTRLNTALAECRGNIAHIRDRDELIPDEVAFFDMIITIARAADHLAVLARPRE